MKMLARTALLVATFFVPLAVTPAIGAQTAAQPTLTTIKSDRGAHSQHAQMILDRIAAENDD